MTQASARTYKRSLRPKKNLRSFRAKSFSRSLLTFFFARRPCLLPQPLRSARCRRVATPHLGPPQQIVRVLPERGNVTETNARDRGAVAFEAAVGDRDPRPVNGLVVAAEPVSSVSSQPCQFGDTGMKGEPRDAAIERGFEAVQLAQALGGSIASPRGLLVPSAERRTSIVGENGVLQPTEVVVRLAQIVVPARILGVLRHVRDQLLDVALELAALGFR